MTQTHPYFVPAGDSLSDTAVTLLAVAEENDLPVRSVSAVQGGFNVTAELAELLGIEPEDEDTSAADEAAAAEAAAAEAAAAEAAEAAQAEADAAAATVAPKRTRSSKTSG